MFEEKPTNQSAVMTTPPGDHNTKTLADLRAATEIQSLPTTPRDKRKGGGKHEL